MRDFTERVLGRAKDLKATYADLRIVKNTSERINVRNGVVSSITSNTDEGFGVRVIADGAWGFASSPRIDEAEIDEIVARAVRIARASSMHRKDSVALSEEDVVSDARYSTAHTRDPLNIRLEEKVDLLLQADKLMRVGEEIRSTNSVMGIARQDKTFASSEGAFIEQDLLETGTLIQATAVAKGDAQVRSYPNGRSGAFRTGGFEVIDELDLVGNAEEVGKEAVELVQADQCPSLEGDLILHGNQLGLQIHESIGHPIELDRVLGSEVSMAGASFLTTDKLGQLRYGSDIVNVVADATAPGGMGTFGYDDEGVPAQRASIIRDGQFEGYLSSRETATEIGQRSSGAALATNWNKIPLVRMTNINLEPGDWDLDELIRDTKRGIMMEGTKTGSIDDMRVNFQFGPEVAWEIEDGSIKRMLKNPVYTGSSLDFWRSCDAIASSEHWDMWGTPTCGKGQPGQVAHVGHGAAPARFKDIRIGVGKW